MFFLSANNRVACLGFAPTETFFEVDSPVNRSVGKTWVVTRH